MSSSTRDKDATWIWLSEAKALLAEEYGGASQLAEKLLRQAGAAGRLPIGYLRKNGDAADDEFWRHANIDFEENSASVGITFFVLGHGVGHDDGLRSTEYLGISVSRAAVLALLQGAPADADAPPPSADAPPASPAPRRPSDAAVEQCFRGIMKGRPDDPPDEDWLFAEMKRRLGASPVRQRVRNLWREIAPQWKRPRGHPRNFNSAKKSAV